MILLLFQICKQHASNINIMSNNFHLRTLQVKNVIYLIWKSKNCIVHNNFPWKWCIIRHDFYIVIKRKCKQWWSIIPPISTKLITTSQVKPMNTIKDHNIWHWKSRCSILKFSKTNLWWHMVTHNVE